MRLLLVEDDDLLGRATAQMLTRLGAQVDWVGTGRDALAALRTTPFQAAVLDLGLPDMDGEQVVRQLRAASSDTPIIVLTARDQLDDLVRVLDFGADDYIIKPCDVTELMARIRAVRRRTLTGASLSATQDIGPLKLDQATRRVHWNGAEVQLTAREFGVLNILLMQRTKVVPRDQLIDSLYGWNDEIESNAVEVYVHYLRRKIAKQVVVTVRGIGYQLGSEEALVAAARDSMKP